MFDLDHPFFRPLWIRLAVVVLCFGWAAVELSGGYTGWAMLFGGLGGYSAWRFFVTFDPRDPEE
ncbi:DUF3329 domain-containing protein [Psychromarinibacter sp. C21-152]|uniref:DUF3329 domain-containing protein n=1 Tax=Psychromarinibacter sediminicola TaxID=3033385 RepID=A0AAE3T8B2_9RHOB|nr:DUF3329 domain-containing protein [Psychromarinibacter sediminicola]MDF0599904.1 DUF3329 domain-containing protein [Psychromarinibacter sediminicola]